jgi:hypothetical protein
MLVVVLETIVKLLVHRDDYQGSVHFNGAGSAIQAEQAAATIQNLLTEK